MGTNGAAHCSPEVATNPASGCANVAQFSKGRSVAVNDEKFRFPYWVSDSDQTKGIDAIAKAYTNCDKNALCIFITLPEPEREKALTVNYKFKTLIRASPATES